MRSFYFNSHSRSDKTVRLFKWEIGSGFTEDAHSPFIGHKYAVTRATFSPKVSGLEMTIIQNDMRRLLMKHVNVLVGVVGALFCRQPEFQSEIISLIDHFQFVVQFR